MSAVAAAENVIVRAMERRISSWSPAPKFFAMTIAKPVTSPLIMLNISDTTEAVEPTAASEFLPSCLR